MTRPRSLTSAAVLGWKQGSGSNGSKDRASPPNSAAMVHRRVQVVCKADEKVCTNSDGSLSCSYGGICMGAVPTPAPATTAAAFPASASIVPALSLNGPTSITISAGQPYAPCTGTMTSNCEMGATATVDAIGDFNGRIRACADLVGVNFKIQRFHKFSKYRCTG